MKPILFNTEMVRAIQNGTKTATRRVVKPRYGGNLEVHDDPFGTPRLSEKCGCLCRGLKPPYRPGDILYVRETWLKDSVRYMYKANYSDDEKFYRGGKEVSIKWRPSIHMPREAARIFLRVTGVRVERLREITELDILEKEGITVGFPQPKPFYVSLAYTETRLKPAVRKAFADLWDSTIKPADRARYRWEANPWVWVIEFERCGKPGTMCRT